MSPLGLFLGFFSISFAYENIALNKSAYQQYPFYLLPNNQMQAGNAVDGQRSNLSWQGGQCTISLGRQTATWWVNLTSILSIHHITVYYRTGNVEWGPSNGYAPRFLGFSVYVSNTTNRSDGTLCFKDTYFTTSTIPAVFNTTCLVHGQYVIYYNERLSGVTYPDGYSELAHNGICELEVYGCPIPGFYGTDCSIPCPYPHCRYCHIETGTCLECESGYEGHQCEQECNTGFYGDACMRKCGHCADLSRCHHVTGECLSGCKPGYKGNYCFQQCTSGFYGNGCQRECGHCALSECYHVNGLCLSGCETGYKGLNCLKPCDDKRFGKDCSKECGSCLQLQQCLHTNGTCQNGCDPGFHGSTCSEECPENYFGFDCKRICSANCKGCNKVTGVCENGCHAGWRGSYCHEKCGIGYYGEECSRKCGHCFQNESCHHINGRCLRSCESGYEAPFCNKECIDGKYGLNCTEECGNCIDASYCFHETGTCLTGCRSGFQGLLCKEAMKRGSVELNNLKVRQTKGTDWQAGFFGVLALFCFLLIGILIAGMRRFSSQKREPQDVKKKYYNIKQRSKEKLDQIKRPKTGGGQVVKLTSAEDLFLSGMEGRPQIEGLSFGIDTDISDPAISDGLEGAVAEDVQSTSSGIPSADRDGPLVNSARAVALGLSCDKSKKEKFGANSRKRIALLEEENLKLDNERLRLEINQLKKNNEIIDLQKEILILKKQKLECEIQANYPFFTEALPSRNHSSTMSEY